MQLRKKVAEFTGKFQSEKEEKLHICFPVIAMGKQTMCLKKTTTPRLTVSPRDENQEQNSLQECKTMLEVPLKKQEKNKTHNR